MTCCLQPAANPYEDAPFLRDRQGAIRPGGLRVTEEAVRNCGFLPGASILDVGCGIGATVMFLRDRYALDAIGVDISARLIEEALVLRPDLPLVQADAAELPFKDAVFDGVVAECSLSVAGDAGALLAEIGRVLVPGGRLLVSDVYFRAPAERLRERRPTGCLAHALSREEFREILEACGFALRSWEDRTLELRNYVASMAMKGGDAASFWGVGLCDPALAAARPGYFSLSAVRI